MKLKPLNYLYLFFGLVVSSYGLVAIFTQEISASGSQLRGLGWQVVGMPAIFGGILIFIFGVYIIYVSISTKA